MAITREKKENIIAGLKDAATSSQSMVFVNFHGLPVTETNELRSALREKDVSYTVARKTLIKRALAEAKIEGTMPELEGEIAVAYGNDSVVPAGSVAEFAKKHKDNLSIVGGIFEGRFMGKSEMEVISSIPGMDTLRGMFVNVINSPIAGVVVALQAIADKKTT